MSRKSSKVNCVSYSHTFSQHALCSSTHAEQCAVLSLAAYHRMLARSAVSPGLDAALVE